MTPKALGQMIQRKRGSMGVRAAASEIGISFATISRIENGRVPDLETLKKICRWLRIDPASYLGSKKDQTKASPLSVQVVFKKDRAVSPRTSRALAKLIEAAYQQFAATVTPDGHE
jgi:transcriptional regulator with XRE-family HTH domain